MQRIQQPASLEFPWGAWGHVGDIVEPRCPDHFLLACRRLAHRRTCRNRQKPIPCETQTITFTRLLDVDVAPVWQHQQYALGPRGRNDLCERKVFAEQERASFRSAHVSAPLVTRQPEVIFDVDEGFNEVGQIISGGLLVASCEHIVIPAFDRVNP